MRYPPKPPQLRQILLEFHRDRRHVELKFLDVVSPTTVKSAVLSIVKILEHLVLIGRPGRSPIWKERAQVEGVEVFQLLGEARDVSAALRRSRMRKSRLAGGPERRGWMGEEEEEGRGTDCKGRRFSVLREVGRIVQSQIL